MRTRIDREVLVEFSRTAKRAAPLPEACPPDSTLTNPAPIADQLQSALDAETVAEKLPVV
jgi:hypothetical protein